MTSALNKWCQVKNDLLFAFEQLLESNLMPSLRTEIEAMLSRIRAGMPIDKALLLFSDYSQQEQFQELVIAVRVNMKYRGNLTTLLGNLELQFFRLEEAYQQRRISNKIDYKTVMFCQLTSLLFVAIRLKTNITVRLLFLQDIYGHLLLLSMLFCLLGAFVLLYLIGRSLND